MTNATPYFNGERADPLNETYPLGNGYRAFNPVLMRFYHPDNLSSFGAGGINPYAYCDCDPINRADPSGHHSALGWLGIATGVVLGVLLTPVSGATSLAVALSAISAATAALSLGLAVAQQFMEECASHTASALGWAALGAGIVSALSSAALSRMIPDAKSLVSLLKGPSNRPFSGMMMTGNTAASTRKGEDGTAIAEVGRIVSHKNNVTVYDLNSHAFQPSPYFHEWRLPNNIHRSATTSLDCGGRCGTSAMKSVKSWTPHKT